MSGSSGRIPDLARFFAPGTIALTIESPDITYRVAPVDALVRRQQPAISRRLPEVESRK